MFVGVIACLLYTSFTAAAIGNVYFKDAFSLPVRVVGVVVALLIAFGLAAITNQGTKARTFFS